MPEPSKADLTVAHYTKRKCEKIVDDTFAAFRKSSDGWGSLSLDELFAIGLALVFRIVVKPWEKASTDPERMRKELGRQLRMYIERGTDLEN